MKIIMKLTLITGLVLSAFVYAEIKAPMRWLPRLILINV